MTSIPGLLSDGTEVEAQALKIRDSVAELGMRQMFNIATMRQRVKALVTR